MKFNSQQKNSDRTLRILGILTTSTFMTLGLLGCDSGSSDFAALDKSQGANKIRCQLDAFSPANKTLKVASTAGTKTLLTVTPSTSTCEVFFFVNNVKINTTSANFLELDSALLNAGVNIVRVEGTNSLGSDSSEWKVEKNTPPTCSRTLPTTANLNMSSNATQSFTVAAVAEPGETLSFAWKLDNQADAALVETISAANASQAVLTGQPILTGLKTVTAEVSDGMDKVTCNWSVNIGTDCSLTAKAPNTAMVRMAAANGTSTGFSVTASTASCVVSWTLNGIDLTGSGVSRNIQSNELITGANVLRADVTSSSGSTAQTWTVIKNTPPTCAQTPAATGNSVSVSSVLNLSANISDANSDSVNWTWRQNGSTLSGPAVVVTNGVNSTTAAFTPTATHIGYNSFELRMDDGYDTSTCMWAAQVNPLCQITTASPATPNVTVANLATTLNTFSIGASDGSCALSWSLNGVSLGSSASVVSLLSSGLLNSNTLTATASNSSSSQSYTWNLTKNALPVCASFSPLNSGTNLAVASTRNFIATITDANVGQTHTFDWRLDGNVPSATYFTSSSNALSTTGSWTALSGQVGSHSLVANVSDGFDSVACTWPVDVLRNCAVTSSSPAGTSLRVSNAPSTSTSFGVVANDPGCAIQWKLNSVNVSTDVNFQPFLSSELSNGTSDTISATLTNAIGSTTRNWSVSKNSKPVCASQAPAALGNAINTGGSQIFTGNATDAENDTLAFTWTLDGSTTAPFSSIASSTFSSSATLIPGLGQVGNGHTVALTMNDGFDSAKCAWTLDVVDPNSAQIVSWTPVISPAVILSTGDQTFTVSATGTGLTYAWYLDSVIQVSKTSSAETFAASDMTIGPHTLQVVVTDTYNNTAFKNFSVVRNAPPVKSAFTPNVAGVSVFRVNLNGTLGFSVAAADANADLLTYTWTLDSTNSQYLVGTTTTASLKPAGNSLLLGPHVVRVTISDGYESVSQSWNIMVNYFSNDCNDLYNSSPSGPNGGRTCTLIGNPSMGDGQDILTDATLLKAKPYHIVELETNVVAFSEHLNHTVSVFNMNSAGSVSYFGHVIAAKTMKVVLGNGAAGRNTDASSAVDAFQTVGAIPNQVRMPIFKLNEPRGLAYDSSTHILYIADRNNRRVLALNASGEVNRVLGTSAAGNTQNSTTNSVSETFGYDQVCSEPMSMAISGRSLYVGCWAQHAIKRVNINDPTDPLTYGLTRTEVGRQSASSTNLVSPVSGVSADGLAGPSPDPATGAVTYANNVIGMAADNAGVIYWLERAGGNQGLRLRAYNTSNVDVEFYGANPNSDHVSLPSGFNFQAFDLSATPLTTSPQQSNIVNAVSGILAAVGVQNLGILGVNNCHLVNVRLLDASLAPIVLGSSSVVTMSMASGTGAFYSDSGCSVGLAANQFTIPTGVSQGSVWMKVTAAGAYSARAATGGFNSLAAGTAIAISAAAPNTLRISAAPRFRPDECIPVEITQTNGTTPATNGVPRYVSPATNNYGTFYSNASCSTPVDRVLFSITDVSKFVYFKRNVVIPPGWVASLAGYNNTAAASYGQYAAGVKIGMMRFEDGQTGLDVMKNLVTGLPDGFFFSNTSHHYVSYVNLKSVDAGFAVSIPAQSSEIVFGLGNSATPTDITGGYNGEDAPAWGTRLNQPVGVSVNLAQTKLFVGDYVNNRGRTYEIDGLGYARSSIGAGRQRDRVGVTVLDSTEVALVSPYKLEVFAGSIYFSEYGNNRIRRTNLSSGITEVIAGNGSSGTPTEGNDAIFDTMTNPRGFKVIPYPNAVAPTNYVLFYAETCQIRAVNLSGGTLSNFYGVGNLLKGKVKTIAGDTSFGCGTWNSLPNTDGMTAITARLNVPEDIAVIDGDIYIISASDHCLLRVTPDGKIYRPQGPSSCATGAPVSNDATMDNMRTRSPKSFAPDAANPGNYFLIDQYSDSTGFIRYMNVGTTGISFKNQAPISVAARANPSANIPVKTIYQYPAGTGASGVGGVASWIETSGSAGNNDKVCWTAGVLNQGGNGAHAVYCANRYQDDDGVLAAGPASGSSIRAGAPLDREQEKISRLNATFYSPYGIAFDDDGNLYISEFNNHVIRMIRRWW